MNGWERHPNETTPTPEPSRGIDTLFLVVAGVLLAGLVYRGYGSGVTPRPVERIRGNGDVTIGWTPPNGSSVFSPPGNATTVPHVSGYRPGPGNSPENGSGEGDTLPRRGTPDREWNRGEPPKLPPLGLPTMAMSAGVAKLRPGDPLLDVNRATEAELLRLPGIGPTLANRIVSQRPYHAVDDLRRVKGIGVKTLESLRPFVQVQSP